MPTLDPDWPPLVSYLVVLLGMALTTWLATRGTRRDVREIKEQTNNSHESNLRQDVDEAKSDAREAKEGVHRVERLVVDLSKSIRAVEHSLDRRTGLQERAIGELTDDTIPTAVAQAMAEHVRTHHPKEHP